MVVLRDVGGSTPGDSSVWGNGVWLGSFASMIVPFGIATLVGLKFENLWARLAFFSVCSVLGFTLFGIFGGVWAAYHAADDATGAIRAAFRNQLAAQIGFILAMMWFAIWRLPKRIAATSDRIQITPGSD